MFHRVLKSVFSVVRMIIVRVSVPKLGDGSSSPKKRNLGTHAYGAWTCNNTDNSRVEKRSSDSLPGGYPLYGTVVSPVQDDDVYEVRAAVLVESEGFGGLDCGATTSFGSVEGAEALFSKSHEHDTRFPEVDPFGGRSFNFGDGASSKATSLSRLPVRNDALGDFWIPVHLFVDQPKPTPLMLGMDFLKEQRCVIDYGKDLIRFPMQSSVCVEWWLVLHATVRSTLGAFITRTLTNCLHRERLSGVSLW